jgi:hypothetical protein
MSASDRPIEVEVYVHAAGTSVWNDQARVVRRVEAFDERGVVRDVSVRMWPRRVCTAGGLEATAFHSDALATIERLSTWADDAGVSLPFDRHRVVSEFARVDHEVIDTPAICAAASEEGSLLGVYPHQHDTKTCTVGDLLDRVDREGASGVTCQPDVASSLASPSVTSTDGA